MASQHRRNSEPHVAVCVDKSRSYGRGVLLGIADFLEKVGHWSMFIDHYASSQLTAEWIRRWRGDGILAYVSDEEAARLFMRSKIPIVDVAGHVRIDSLPSVAADDEKIGRLAAEHLVERHFRHFAYVGPGDTPLDEWRYHGFSNNLKSTTCHRYIHPRGSVNLAHWERKQQALTKWIRSLPRPLGIMAFSDIQAREVVDACSRGELSVPLEVAVVGVDNDEELCRLCRVPLSSVASNPRRIGFEAAQLIHRLMNRERSESIEPVPHLFVPPLYVVPRHSSDVRVVDDLDVGRALAYIHRHAAESINVDTVARAIGVPRRSLYRRFAETLQRTPHEELQRARFERARRMLAETELSIADIAHLSGFDTGAYLCTCFKQEFGMTPGEFRESSQNPGR